MTTQCYCSSPRTGPTDPHEQPCVQRRLNDALVANNGTLVKLCRELVQHMILKGTDSKFTDRISNEIGEHEHNPNTMPSAWD